MFQCYEDELLESVNINNGKVKIELISKEHKIGKIFKDVYLKMNFDIEIDSSYESMCNVILGLMPVFVVKFSNEIYSCVGNRRTLQIAKTVFPPSKKIPVKIIDNNHELIRQMMLIDVVVGPLFFSFNTCERKTFMKEVRQELKNINNINIATSAVPKIRKFEVVNNLLDDLSETKNVNKFIYRKNIGEELTDDCVRLLMLMFPIFITKNADSVYECVGNKLIHLVSDNAKCNTELHAVKIMLHSKEINQSLCKVDSLLLGYVFSMVENGAQFLGEAIKRLERVDKAWIFKGRKRLKDISLMSGYSTKYLFNLQARHTVNILDKKNKDRSDDLDF